MTAFTKTAKESAKEHGMHLFRMELNGKYAKDDSFSLACPIGPEMAERIWAIFKDCADVKKREK